MSWSVVEVKKFNHFYKIAGAVGSNQKGREKDGKGRGDLFSLLHLSPNPYPSPFVPATFPGSLSSRGETTLSLSLSISPRMGWREP